LLKNRNPVLPQLENNFDTPHFLHSDRSQINLGAANLAGTNLADANLASANLIGANLTGANLTGSNFTYTCLFDSLLSET
jgi:uncharacterized protein YjbI with pentapeptide repeats